MATYTYVLPTKTISTTGLYYKLGLKIPSREVITGITMGSGSETVHYVYNTRHRYGCKICVFLGDHNLLKNEIDWSNQYLFDDRYRFLFYDGLAYSSSGSHHNTSSSDGNYNYSISFTTNLEQFTGKMVDLYLYGIAYNSDGTWTSIEDGDVSVTLDSAYPFTITTSPISVIHSGRYNGSTWGKTLPMRYDGSNWVEGELQRYNGTSWDNVDTQ